MADTYTTNKLIEQLVQHAREADDCGQPMERVDPRDVLTLYERLVAAQQARTNASDKDFQDDAILAAAAQADQWEKPFPPDGASAQERAECDCEFPDFCSQKGCLHKMDPRSIYSPGPRQAIPEPALDGASGKKDTNPKDAVGIRKWRQIACVPFTVLWEVGVGMLEGARKYGRHNYRVVGVRASVYVDASMGHIMQWWEGEDTDPDSRLSHITKAICSLVVLRDAMIQGMLTDDRPPRGNIDVQRYAMQQAVDALFDSYPDPADAYTEKGD